ncbi:hypothetical protein RM545_12195 [Zunongwangia sp. F260]|uniref:TolC family protein n=1 Tax=Autumnicola lenta TaxID=3075593 RepID=A0ABU3CM72_9FLAO|nr:hypothetical protein [Zunongwangia sp. F260]MDT0647453.1 hypothetical protein [Zunongwangia sp. F260]
MKNQFLHFQRRASMWSLLLLSLLLVNCGTEDVDFIDPYEFVNEDFNDIPNLAEIEDADPVIIEPEVGSVDNSAETQAIIDDILNAGPDGEISQESRTKLAAVGAFTADLPASINERAQALDAAGIASIMDESTPLDADLEELAAALANAPEEIRMLLPRINFTVDLEGLRAVTNPNTKNQVLPGFDGFNVVSQTISNPCEEAAYEAYELRIEELIEQADANYFIIESNYARRLDEADVRYEERTALQEERYAESKAAIIATLENLLLTAQQLENMGETELATQLRELTLMYAVAARNALIEWDILVAELLINFMEQEKAQALEIRERLTTQVNTDFETVEDMADARLTTAVNNCHNQGSGN